jgi:sterol desaturase/sphingolipid hydroxylase (fatty acid hydroxylase superfamily)
MKPAFLLRFGIYILVLAVMLFSEKLAPFARSEQRKSSRVFFHLGLSFGNAVILALILSGPTYAAARYVQEHQWGLAHAFGFGGGMEIVLGLILLDVWDYWMHRAYHRIGFLWRFHMAHHSDMELDVTTASRFHLLELIISGISKCLMILICGISLWAVVIFETLLTAASQFHHSNVNIPLKFQDGLERFIVTPRMHRCHHSLHETCFNTNFSSILNVWDRLFLSYHWGRDVDQLKPIGLSKPRGPVTMQVVPFLLTPLKTETNQTGV